MEINWPLTFKLLSPSKITNTHTNTQDSKSRTFRFKTWIKELPTMEKLHKRNPEIYINKTCKICNRHTDSDLHPFTCGVNIPHLQNKLTTFLTEECSARANQTKQNEPIPEKWKQTQIYTQHNEEPQPWHKTEWKDILRGVITHKILQIAEEITGNKESAKEAVLQAMEKFWQLKYETWKFRCDIVTQWEKENNITKKQKKTNPKKTHHKTQKPPPNKEQKYTTDIFNSLYINLTNIALTNIINNGHSFFNFFSISISASGVLTR
jgi:hypothetical protein